MFTDIAIMTRGLGTLTMTHARVAPPPTAPCAQPEDRGLGGTSKGMGGPNSAHHTPKLGQPPTGEVARTAATCPGTWRKETLEDAGDPPSNRC